MTTISSTDFIGNSVSALNANFEYLDSTIFNLNSSTDQLLTIQGLGLSDFSDMITTVNTNSSKWLNSDTIISSNSSFWIKSPIVYIDSVVYPYNINYSVNVPTVSTNFVKEHPIFIAGWDAPLYIEGQQALLYFYTYKDSQSDVTGNSFSAPVSCYCQGNEGIVEAIIDCTNVLQNTAPKAVSCSNGGITCKSCIYTCKQNTKFKCVYTMLDGTHNYVKKISTSIGYNVKYSDRIDKEVYGARFEVLNCEWVFKNYIL